MARFSDVLRGTLARKPGVTASTIHNAALEFDLRVISAADDDVILERASARCRDGKEGPEHPRFELECAVQLIAIAAIDSTSPQDAPRPFFDNAEQVRDNLDRDTVHALAAEQGVFQGQVSPLKRSATQAETMQMTARLATLPEGAPSPLARWAPSLQFSYMRALAVLAWSLLQSRSSTGIDSSGPDSWPTPDSPKPSTDSR